jgi:uncharacterized Zn finger protein
MEKKSNRKSPNGDSVGDIQMLKQLINSLEQSGEKLEHFYKEKDAENLNKAKKFMLHIHDKISESMK